jgi:hypothetical protein
MSVLGHLVRVPLNLRRPRHRSPGSGFPQRMFMLTDAIGEILRAPLERQSWMYTKGGHYGQYTSEIVLLPDWGMGYSVLASGVEVSLAVDTVANIVAEIVVGALDEAAAEEANVTYAGRYENDGDVMVLEVDDGPGLLVSEWTWNGTDALALYAMLNGAENATMRLWPTTLTSPGKVGFRSYVQKLPVVLNPYPVLGNCISWLTTDQLVYGGVGLDDFVMEVEDGKAKAVQARGLRVKYER